MVSLGLMPFASSALSMDWSTPALGAWLLAVVARGAWAGPVSVLAVYALAGGAGFLVLAAIHARQRR
jgi:hypothetical protein